MQIKQYKQKFFFNGEIYELRTYKLFSLLDLITFFRYKKNLIVIEYNGEILSPLYWLKTTIKKNDQIEIITIVGGG